MAQSDKGVQADMQQRLLRARTVIERRPAPTLGSLIALFAASYVVPPADSRLLSVGVCVVAIVLLATVLRSAALAADREIPTWNALRALYARRGRDITLTAAVFAAAFVFVFAGLDWVDDALGMNHANTTFGALMLYVLVGIRFARLRLALTMQGVAAIVAGVAVSLLPALPLTNAAGIVAAFVLVLIAVIDSDELFVTQLSSE